MKTVKMKAQKKPMKKQHLWIAAGFLIVLCIGTMWAMPKSKLLEKSEIFSAQEVIALSEKTADLIYEDHYEELWQYAAEPIRTATEPEAMKDVKKQFAEDWGAFQSYENVRAAEMKQRGQMQAVVQFEAVYEHVTIDYTLTFNTDLTLIGLYMKPLEEKES